MTRHIPSPARSHRTLRLAVLSIAGALALAITPATAAYAQTAYWSPVQSACGAKYVQLTFHVSGTSGIVHVGYSDRDSGYSNGPYWALRKGTNTIETGLKTVVWQKWSNIGNADVTSWTKTCVNFT